MRVVAWIIKMEKTLLTRIRKESSGVVGNKIQQGRLTLSLLGEVKEEIIRGKFQGKLK